MAAPGSARFTSPSSASEALTPPKVGSVSTEKYGTPAACRRPTAPLTFAICISARTPSCMRAPLLGHQADAAAGAVGGQGDGWELRAGHGDVDYAHGENPLPTLPARGRDTLTASYGEAAVHYEDMGGDEACCGGGQEGDGG